MFMSRARARIYDHTINFCYDLSLPTKPSKACLFREEGEQISAVGTHAFYTAYIVSARQYHIAIRRHSNLLIKTRKCRFKIIFYVSTKSYISLFFIKTITRCFRSELELESLLMNKKIALFSVPTGIIVIVTNHPKDIY